MRLRARTTLAVAALFGLPAFVLATPASATSVPSGFVYAQGTQLMLNGAPYHFKGFNMYNANSRGSCWYSTQDPEMTQSLQAMGVGANAIRAWFFQDMVYSSATSAAQWAAFDQTLRDAAAANMKVIVTLSNEWGSCDQPPGYKDITWYQRGYKSLASPHEAYRTWVQEVVNRYRGNPTVLAWQLMNEAEAAQIVGSGHTCNESSAESALASWAGDMAGLVKSVDPYHLLSLGTLGGNQCGIVGSDYQRLHATRGIDLCEYHDYGDPDNPYPGTSTDGLGARMAQCGITGLNKPLFLGETGISPDHSVVVVPDQPVEQQLLGTNGCAASQLALGSTCPLDGIPCQSSLQTTCRASDFQYKLEMEMRTGVAGALIWNWCDPTQSSICRQPSHDDVSPGDPVIPMLAAV